jgi:hypothetical protein
MAGDTTPTEGSVKRYVYLVVGLILGPPIIVAILGFALIATPFWSISWAVRNNGPLDKSPKDWWDAIWDLVAKRMVLAWWKFIRGDESQVDETPDLPQAVLPRRVTDRLRIGSQAQTIDRPH